jgi:hypothetical protein
MAEQARQAKLAAAKAQRAAELPVWLRTKPRTPRQEREARRYCEIQGIPYPYDEKPAGR